MRCMLLVVPYQCSARSGAEHRALTAAMEAAVREIGWGLGEVIVHDKTEDDLRELEVLKRDRRYLDLVAVSSVLAS